MNKKLFLMLIVGIFLAKGSVMAKDYSKEIRTIKAARSIKAPVLNGDLNDDVWKGAQKEKDFRLPKSKGLSKAKTEVMTCWTSSTLYIGMICYEPDMQKIKRKYVEPADRFTWKYGTDEIELFITPNYNNPELGYFHFAISAGGQIYHKYHKRIGAKSFPRQIYDIKVATKEFDDRWQLEIAIPFKELVYPDNGAHTQTTPGNNDKWMITFGRFSNNHRQEWSSWNAGTFHRAGPLGELVFLDNSPVAKIKVTDNMEQVIGQKNLQVSIENTSEKEKAFKATAQLTGKKQEKTVKLKGGQKKNVNFTFALKEGGQHNLYYTVSANEQPIYTGRVLYDITPVAVPVKELLKKAKEIKKTFPKDKELLKFISKLDSFMKDWNGSLKDIDTTSYKKWVALEKNSQGLLEEGEALVEKLNKGKVQNEMRKNLTQKVKLEYGVGVVDNMTKVRPDDIFSGKITDKISFSMARNEHENGQIVILPFKKKLKNVRFHASHLMGIGMGGAKIPFTRVKIRPVGLVEVPEMPGINGRTSKSGGFWPDPILETDKWDCAPGKLQSFWLDVQTAHDQAPGVYRGTVEIVPENSHPIKLNLQVKVWDFTIPERSSLRVDYWFHEHEIAGYYGHGMDLVETKKYAEFLWSYRVPTNLLYRVLWRKIQVIKDEDGTYSFDYSMFDKYLKICYENGLNVFNLNMGPNDISRFLFPVGKQMPWTKFKYYDKKTGKIMGKEEGFGEKGSEKQYFLFIKDFADHLRKLEWFDFKCVVYNAFDECQPIGEKFEKMKRFNMKIKEILPDVPRTFAMNTFSPKEFKGYVDTWIPVIERITKGQVQDIRKRGEKVWWYTMGYPQWPDYHVNQDGVDHVVIPWLNWKFNVTGVLRWTSNSWPYRKIPKEEKPALDKLWPETPWRKMKGYESAGFLFYPGPDGTPWPSIRLEMLRNSFENYEYFKLLNDLVKSEKNLPAELTKEANELLAIPDSLVKSQGDYSRNSEDFIKYREKIGNLIEKIRNHQKNDGK